MTHTELMNLSLEHVVERIGDPTIPVFDLMYQRYPDLERFRTRDRQWEHYMMQEIIGNLLLFSENPQAARVTIRDMSAHHDLIGVTTDVFSGMYAAMLEVFETAFDGDQREAMIGAWQATIAGIKGEVGGVAY